MTEPLDNVLQQMLAAGLEGLNKPDLVTDGNLHRFKPGWEPKAKKRAYYALHWFKLDSGKEIITGVFGWFKGAENYHFKVNIKNESSLAKDEWSRIRKDQAEKQRLVADEHEQLAQAAAKKAALIWGKCGLYGKSNYIAGKKIAAIGCRFSRGSVVLPVQCLDGHLYGLQFIDSEGNKRFLTGTKKAGRFCLIGQITEEITYIGVCEGWATGVSCHMATGWPVLAAFDCGNLLLVAGAVRARYPDLKIIVFGDDDLRTPGNPGRQKALEAARFVNGAAIFPPFMEEVVPFEKR